MDQYVHQAIAVAGFGDLQVIVSDDGQVSAPSIDENGAPIDRLTPAQRTAVEAVVQAYLTTGALVIYANAKQWALATGGYTVTLAGVARTFPTDATSQGLMTGKFIRLAQPNAPTTINWQFTTGFVPLATADFASAAVKVADFVQATFDALQAVLAAIAAGTVTSREAVDAFAWPSNVAAG